MLNEDPYAEIQRLIAGLPATASAVVAKSRYFRTHDEVDLAVTLLRRAIAENPAPALLAEHADLLLARDDVDDALEVAFRAITADPLNEAARAVLSRVLLDGLPDAFVYLVEVSRLFADEEEPQFAEELIRRAIERHPKNVALRVHLARFYGEYARTDESVAALHAALELNPENAEAHAMLAAAMLEEGDPAGAQRWLDQAIVLGADSPMTAAIQEKIRELVDRIESSKR